MHTSKNRYTYTCYNITLVQFDRGLACKKIIQSSTNKKKERKCHSSAGTSERKNRTQNNLHGKVSLMQFVMTGTVKIHIESRQYQDTQG